MPIDNRRIQGPEISTPYSMFFADLPKTENTNQNEKNNYYMRTGVVSEAKGSAYVEQNGTKVICSVFDPREIPFKLEYSIFGELYCEFKYAPFSTTIRRGHQQDAEEKELSLSLKRALEPTVCLHEFPNFQVDIYAIVLEDCGSALASAITCAGLALNNASVPMYDLIAASSMVVPNETISSPPSDESQCQGSEEKSKPDFLTVAYMPSHEQITYLDYMGSDNFDCIENCMDTLVETCKEIYNLSQKCLAENIIQKSRSEKKK